MIGTHSPAGRSLMSVGDQYVLRALEALDADNAYWPDADAEPESYRFRLDGLSPVQSYVGDVRVIPHATWLHWPPRLREGWTRKSYHGVHLRLEAGPAN